jgi:HAD superfamily hydrolase (TIGR01509 family)
MGIVPSSAAAWRGASGAGVVSVIVQPLVFSGIDQFSRSEAYEPGQATTNQTRFAVRCTRVDNVAVVLTRDMRWRGWRDKVSDGTAFLFDLDGTLVDSVYQHVLAWRLALQEVGIDLSVWRIHRRIGMSGGLFINALLRETELGVTPEQVARVQSLHAQAYQELAPQVRPLPGARELLATLTAGGVPWAIATSGRWDVAGPVLETLDVPEVVPIVTRDQVRHAKPDPDLFLAAAERLGVDIESAVVVGDSIWDLLAARRARALGVGLLSGGYGRAELETAGAYRVYEDPADLLLHLDEVGVRGAV